MSDSTIDDALRLLEVGKGNPDRLKQIIESFETRSLISMQDRRYVEALVAQYLTPRHRVSIKKIEPVRKKQVEFPRIRKPTKPTFDPKTDSTSTQNKVKTASVEENSICMKCDAVNPSGNNFCNECGSPLQQTQKVASVNEMGKVETEFEKYEREYLERQSGVKTDSDSQESSLEEKFVEHVETEILSASPRKKSNKKFIGIGIGIIAILIIAGGAALMVGDMGLSSSSQVEERATCESKPMLVSSTKIPGFPNPEKDLQYYLDRYNNEPSYADWFDRNFQGKTIQDVVC